jgi:hypothetical protein
MKQPESFYYEISVEVNSKKRTDKFFLPEDSSYLSLGRAFYNKTLFIGDTSRLFPSAPVTALADTSKKIQLVPLEGLILMTQNASNPAANVRIDLLNSQGYILASAITGSKGEFKFSNVRADQKYIVKILEDDPVPKKQEQFYMANTAGKVVLTSEKDGRFIVFKNLSPDINITTPMPEVPTKLSVMEGKIIGDDGKIISDKTQLNLVDETGKVLQTIKPDKNGNFRFENLASERKFTVSIRITDALKSFQNVYMVNRKEEMVQKAAKQGDYFVFTNLPVDLNLLSPIETEDKGAIVMRGKILKSDNKEDGIGNVEITLLDNKGKVIK